MKKFLIPFLAGIALILLIAAQPKIGTRGVVLEKDGFATNVTINNNGVGQFLVGSTAEAANDYMKVRVTNSTASFNYGTSSSTNGTFGTWDNTHTFGWNTSAGGGRVVSTEPAFGYVIEADYFGNMEIYGHFIATNGAVGRPVDNWLIQRSGGSAVWQVSANGGMHFYSDAPTNASPTNTMISFLEAGVNVKKRLNIERPAVIYQGFTNLGRIELLAGSDLEAFQSGNVYSWTLSNGVPAWQIGGSRLKLEVTNTAAGPALAWQGTAGFSAPKFFPNATFGTFNPNTYLGVNVWQVQDSGGTYQSAFIQSSELTMGGSMASINAFPAWTTSLGKTGSEFKDLLISNIFSKTIEVTKSLKVGAANQAVITNILSGSATLNFASQNLGGSEDLAITVPGAKDGDAVSLGYESAVATGIIGSFSAFASNGVVFVRFIATAATQNPASGVFRVVVTEF